ncbi:MAG: hypothetical protein ACPMAG_06985 [Limisphaerales bacterium]|jgi:hypothetical protein
MQDYQKLNEFLDRWGDLTTKEKEAIQQGNWDRVQLLQKEKSELQARISTELKDVNDGFNNSGNFPDYHLQWQRVVNKVKGLIEAEKENKQLIDSIIQKIVSDKQLVELNIKNLKKIRSAYGSENLPVWQTYT